MVWQLGLGLIVLFLIATNLILRFCQCRRYHFHHSIPLGVVKQFKKYRDMFIKNYDDSSLQFDF